MADIKKEVEIYVNNVLVENIKQLQAENKRKDERIAELEVKNNDCCMACDYWRFVTGGCGECMYFDKDIYTNEGFYCKSYTEALTKGKE